MALLPGWDSIEISARLHDFFEIAGIVILGVLVLAELLTFIYGHRRDVLTGIAERSAAEQRNAENRALQKRHEIEAAEMQAQLDTAKKNAAEASAKAAQAIAQQMPRRMTDVQKRTLIDALSPISRSESNYYFRDR